MPITSGIRRTEPRITFNEFLDKFLDSIDKSLALTNEFDWRSDRFRPYVESGVIFRDLDWCESDNERADAKLFLKRFQDGIVQMVERGEYKNIDGSIDNAPMILTELFSRGFDPNYKHSNGQNRTLMHGAMSAHRPLVLEMLLAIPSIEINCENIHGHTPLSAVCATAMMDDHFKFGTPLFRVLPQLLADDRLETNTLHPKDADAAWNNTLDEKTTILSLVLSNNPGSVDILKLFLDSKKFDINQHNPAGNSLLHDAVIRCIKHDHIEIEKQKLNPQVTAEILLMMGDPHYKFDPGPLLDDKFHLWPKIPGESDLEFQQRRYRKYPNSIETTDHRQVIKVTAERGNVLIDETSSKTSLFEHPKFTSLRPEAKLILHLDSLGLKSLQLLLAQPHLDVTSQIDGLYAALLKDIVPGGYLPAVQAILEDGRVDLGKRIEYEHPLLAWDVHHDVRHIHGSVLESYLKFQWVLSETDSSPARISAVQTCVKLLLDYEIATHLKPQYKKVKMLGQTLGLDDDVVENQFRPLLDVCSSRILLPETLGFLQGTPHLREILPMLQKFYDDWHFEGMPTDTK